jgi:hypothetical protein
MKRLITAILLFALLIPAAAQAQNDCGNGLPCDRVPWRMPALPLLRTPTPLPGVAITPMPTDGSASVSTPTPIFDVETFQGQVATIQSISAGTPIAFSDQGFVQDPEELGEQAGMFFGYVAGLQAANFGVLAPLLSWFFFAMVFVFGIKGSLLILPVLAAFWGFIRKLIQLVLSFIPGL